MIAYNRTSLDNKTIHDQADLALAAGCIGKEEYTKIQAAYPVAFYTPNIYIRIGLFLLTLVIAIFSFGLLALLFGLGSSGGVGALLIFAGLTCYGFLEYLVINKKHFRSGVDDALLWMAVGLLLTGLGFAVDNISTLSWSVMLFVLTLLASLRFTDCIMSLVAYAALLDTVFNIAWDLGQTSQLVLPFLIMAASVTGYFLFTSLCQKEGCRHYRTSLEILRAASLVSFYASGNYFVVRELSNILYHLPADGGQGVRLGWLFWALTGATPLFYIYRGIQKKDALFLWVGLVLIAAAVFTIRHYYSILPAELAMTIGGLVLVSVSYGLFRYLKTPRHGFTSAATDDKHFLESIHIESLVIAETFTPAAPPTDNFQFGGGSGGGGGAGGQY